MRCIIELRKCSWLVSNDNTSFKVSIGSNSVFMEHLKKFKEKVVPGHQVSNLNILQEIMDYAGIKDAPLFIIRQYDVNLSVLEIDNEDLIRSMMNKFKMFEKAPTEPIYYFKHPGLMYQCLVIDQAMKTGIFMFDFKRFIDDFIAIGGMREFIPLNFDGASYRIKTQTIRTPFRIYEYNQTGLKLLELPPSALNNYNFFKERITLLWENSV